jgi:hypothetical protein
VASYVTTSCTTEIEATMNPFGFDMQSQLSLLNSQPQTAPAWQTEGSSKSASNRRKRSADEDDDSSLLIAPAHKAYITQGRDHLHVVPVSDSSRSISAGPSVGLVGHVENFFIAAYLR